MNGTCKLVDGPKRITLRRQKTERLQVYTAGPDAYLVIKKKDGSTIHVPGPTSKFAHPVEDESIRIVGATLVEASEALVVSKQATGKGMDSGGVEVRLVKGPARFIPAADEWVQKKLIEYIADHNSYLEIKKRDGSISILPGPCSKFLDPVADDAIRLAAAVKIDASEALVVARQREGSGVRPSTGALAAEVASDTDSSVEHRIVRGPAKFIPAANEWVHQKLRGAQFSTSSNWER